MLQAIINRQSALKQELLGEIREVDGKVNNLEGKVDSLSSDMKNEFVKLTVRVDKLGLQLARLEDDAPTNEELDPLEKKGWELREKDCFMRDIHQPQVTFVEEIL